MNEVESISSILGDTPFSTGDTANAEPTPPVVEQKDEPPVETKPEVTQTRDESGKFAKTEPEKSEKPPLSKADVAAIIDERRRRQEAEDKLRALTQDKPKTDIFENPEQAIQERLDEKLAPINERFFKMSMKAAKTGRDDFEEVAGVFAEAAEKDPQLWNAFRSSDDPGEYAYSIGKQLRELGDVGGDITKYREKVTSEMRAELTKRDEQINALRAQLEAVQKSQSELSSVPRSLNNKGSGASPKSEDADPEDITQIVRFKSG